MYYLAMYVVGKMAPGIVNPEDDVPFMNHEKTITTETIKTCRHPPPHIFSFLSQIALP